MKPKVLIVEDDNDLRQVLAIRLRAAAFDVVLAQDGMQAVTMAQRERPDIVLLDLGLPAGDGFSVLRRMADNTNLDQVPVVVLSARDATEMRPKAMEMGAVEYLSKPAEPAELVEVLRRHLPPKFAAPSEAPAAAGGTAAVAPAKPSGGTVMLVEDDEDLRRAMVIRLKAEGFEVVPVSDATSVTTTARRTSPQAIVLDLGLPGGGGFHVLEQLRENTNLSGIPVLVVSARDAEVHRPMALAAGAWEYFQKPVEPAELAAALRRALQGERSGA